MEFIIHNLGKILVFLTGIICLFAAVKNYAKIKAFLSEVRVELSKVSWSTRQELIGATGVVITVTFILAVYVGVVDFSLSRFLALLIK